MADVKELCERIKQRLENEASQMNSAYDRFGMDNTPQSVDPDVFALVAALEQLQAEVEAMRAKEWRPIESAREAFLNMLADASRFDEDVDGDETGITVNYHLTVGHSQLEELANCFGIKQSFHDDGTIFAALERAIAEPPTPPETSNG